MEEAGKSIILFDAPYCGMMSNKSEKTHSGLGKQ